jgi:hypothetical protein
MGFKFYTPNLIETTTALEVLTGDPYATDTAITDFTSLIDRDPTTQFNWTAGAATNASCLQATLSGVVASAVILQNKGNIQNFTIRINSATVAPLNHDTSVSDFLGDTSTNFLLEFATETVNTVELLMNNAPSYNLGQLILANLELELPHNPSFANYKPILTGNKISKTMADGGTTNYNLKEKFSADIDLNLVDASTASDLYALYATQAAHLFVPFETITAWDGDAYEVLFCGNWELKQFAVNDLSQPYFKGGLMIKETPV